MRITFSVTAQSLGRVRLSRLCYKVTAIDLVFNYIYKHSPILLSVTFTGFTWGNHIKMAIRLPKV